MDGTSACVVLGVPPGASRETIKKAFRRLAPKAHPDVSGSATQFCRLKQAYDVALAQSEQLDPKQTQPLAAERSEQVLTPFKATIAPVDVPLAGTVSKRVDRSSSWLTGVLTDFPATDTYNRLVSPTAPVGASRVPSAAARKRSTAFAEVLEEALAAA